MPVTISRNQTYATVTDNYAHNSMPTRYNHITIRLPSNDIQKFPEYMFSRINKFAEISMFSRVVSTLMSHKALNDGQLYLPESGPAFHCASKRTFHLDVLGYEQPRACRCPCYCNYSNYTRCEHVQR